MTKKYQRVLLPVVALLLLFAAATFFSAAKYNVSNPFAVVNGIFQITCRNQQYVEIQASPKVVFAGPDVSLADYMESGGFTENTEEQLGALHVFENGDARQAVFQSGNRYFARWNWSE